jgi:hypothetical protein
MLVAWLALDWGLGAGLLTSGAGNRSVEHVPGKQEKGGDEREARCPAREGGARWRDAGLGRMAGLVDHRSLG